ncbi:MAG: sodium:solute symporter [Bacteroidia bacterium]|nr:sodium:solute symporter [Bacteroidia bacterium]
MLVALTSYIILVFVVAWATTRKAKSGAFFTGDHSSPWFVVAFGMIGASISGVTFVSVPGEVATNGWHYLQFVLGNLVGYQIIAFILIPLYYRRQFISIYSYLGERFGDISHKTGAIFFICSQLLGAGLRFYLALNVLQVVVFHNMGVPLWAEAIVAIFIVWLYIRKVGIKAVVWTDTLQTLCLLVAVFATIGSIFFTMNLNADDIYKLITTHHTFSLLDTDWQSASFLPKHFLSGVAIVVVMNGLDQNIMQKSLTCKNKRDAQMNLVVFSIAFVACTIVFLTLGTALVAYSEYLGINLPSSTDDIYPIIAQNYLPPFIGICFVLGIVAAALSSTDSSLTALTTVWCVDILNTDVISGNKKAEKTKQITTIGFAIALIIVVLAADIINDRSVVSAIFTLAGYTYGPLLGLFVFGMTNQHAIKEKYVPIVCLSAPTLTYLFNLASPYLLCGYKMGFELIILNATLTYLGLWLIKKK